MSRKTLSKVLQLMEALHASVGVRVTLDSGRNNTHACTFCDCRDEPRRLIDIGTYPNGDTITRPVCARCEPIVEARKAKEPTL